MIKLILLFPGIIYFMFIHCLAELSADEVIMFIDQAYTLFLQGYNRDQVITALVDGRKNSCEIKDLVIQIDEVLSKNVSKDDLANIITNYSYPEKLHKQQNFWAKGKVFWLLLKGIIFSAIAFCICFFINRFWHLIKSLLDRLLQFLRGLIDFGSGQTRGGTHVEGVQVDCSALKESGEDRTLQGGCESEHSVDERVCSPGFTDYQDARLTDVCEQSSHDASVELVQELQKQFEIMNSTSRGLLFTLFPMTYKFILYYFDTSLESRVVKQCEYAKSIGLEPSEVYFQPVRPVTALRVKDKFNSLITKQIEYAKSIGLEPAIIPPMLPSSVRF